MDSQVLIWSTHTHNIGLQLYFWLYLGASNSKLLYLWVIRILTSDLDGFATCDDCSFSTMEFIDE